LELWTTSYDLDKDEIVDGPGDALMQALAANTFKDVSTRFDLAKLKAAQNFVERHVNERQQVQKNRLAQDNAAIVRERALVKEISLTNKLGIAQQRLSTVTQDKRAARVIKMNKSHVDGLVRQLESLKHAAKDSKSSLTVEPIAYVYLAT
jgi:hypothetical protein